MDKYRITWLFERLLFIFLLPCLIWFIISFVPSVLRNDDLHEYMRNIYNVLFCISLLIYAVLYGYFWIANILKDYAKNFTEASKRFKRFFIPTASIMILVAIYMIIIENGL